MQLERTVEDLQARAESAEKARAPVSPLKRDAANAKEEVKGLT
jgi:hypothetical protein